MKNILNPDCSVIYYWYDHLVLRDNGDAKIITEAISKGDFETFCKIKNKYPTLTRGVLEKEGKNVNGIYNQDLGSNIMLIEVGGNYNNIEEVMNTIDLIVPIIGDYINEKR